MTNYKINYEASIPEFGEITLEADSADDAEEKAYAEVAKLFPEYLDVEVTMVSEIK
jgi:hypothetical protein